MDYNDLFMELDNKIYFLVIYADTPLSIWNFGIKLIKKYSFMFDEDRKSFYFIHLKKYYNNSIVPEKDSDNVSDNVSDIDSANNYDNETSDKNIPNEVNVNFWNEYK